jgi:hypothetical protein
MGVCAQRSLRAGRLVTARSRFHTLTEGIHISKSKICSTISTRVSSCGVFLDCSHFISMLLSANSMKEYEYRFPYKAQGTIPIANWGTEYPAEVPISDPKS